MTHFGGQPNIPFVKVDDFLYQCEAYPCGPRSIFQFFEHIKNPCLQMFRNPLPIIRNTKEPFGSLVGNVYLDITLLAVFRGRQGIGDQTFEQLFHAILACIQFGLVRSSTES